MNNPIGQLIKKHRLQQNLSQESLCKGICVISYLSKIESGLVIPSEEILTQLLQALGITYYTDHTWLSLSESKRQTFFKLLDFNRYEDALSLFETFFLPEEDKYLCSPLMLDYLLIKAYSLSENSPKKSLALIEELSLYTSTLSDFLHYYLLCLKGSLCLHQTKDFKKAFECLTLANRLYQNANSLSLLASYHFYQGQYSLTIDLNEQAFQLAIDAGNLLCAIDICILQAAAYSNMKNTYLMLKYYNRGLNLCESINNPRYKKNLYYNLGATYLTLKQYDHALNYCQLALELADSDTLPNLNLYHKLALIYIELGEQEKAKSYLDLAYLNLNGKFPPIFREMLDVVDLRLNDPEYLSHPQYLHLLETIYHAIGSHTHFGFKQFHGDYLIACYKAHRRYKDALRVTEELYVHTYSY